MTTYIKVVIIYLWESGAQNLTDGGNQASEEAWFGIQFFSGISNTSSKNTTKDITREKIWNY